MFSYWPWMLNEAYARTFTGGQIDLLWNWEYFGFSQLILGYKQTFTVKKFHDIELISYMLVILMWTAMHHEVITVKVCLYLRINWEKPTFAKFRITINYLTSHTNITVFIIIHKYYLSLIILKSLTVIQTADVKIYS